LPSERIEALRFARDVCENISTWVSLEPVLDPDQTLRLIRTVADLVDFIFIGKFNELSDQKFPNELQRLDANTDWIELIHR
jgi:hypothetical protein